MGHGGPLEWVSLQLLARPVTAVLSHLQLHDSEPSTDVYLTCKASPNDMGGTP